MPAAQAVRRRTQDERSEETKRKLVDAAISCICEDGFANMTTTKVAAIAGVSRGALQHHFSTRFDLLLAIIDQLSKEISKEMVNLADIMPANAHSLEERIDTVIRQYWSVYTSRTFLAVLNIFLGTKNDPVPYRLLQRHMLKFYQGNDEMWLKIFSDIKLPKERLLTLRRLFFGALRGLAVAQILGTLPKTSRRELQALLTAFVREFSDVEKV